MTVDDTTVRRIARLARIKIEDNEVAELRDELSGILDWVEQLNEVDTENVAPMTRVAEHKLKKRKDEVTAGDIADVVVKNAPQSEDDYFVVPKVVE